MIINFKTILFIILSVESFVFLKILDKFYLVVKFTKKIIYLFLARNISDHWKELVLLVYSKILFMNSFIIICFIALLGFILNYFFDSESIGLFFSLNGILQTSIFLLAYIKIKSQIKRLIFE